MKKDRRNFLKSAAGGAAALAAAGTGAKAQQQTAQAGGRISAPGAAAIEAESGSRTGTVEVLTADNPGSDFMVDVMKSLGYAK